MSVLGGHYGGKHIPRLADCSGCFILSNHCGPKIEDKGSSIIHIKALLFGSPQYDVARIHGFGRVSIVSVCVFTGGCFPLDVTEKVQSTRNATCVHLFSGGTRMRSAPFKVSLSSFDLKSRVPTFISCLLGPALADLRDTTDTERGGFAPP